MLLIMTISVTSCKIKWEHLKLMKILELHVMETEEIEGIEGHEGE